MGEREIRYSVSLVYIKQIPTGIESALRVLITDAVSHEEALGRAISHFDEEMKGYNVANKVVLAVYKTSEFTVNLNQN